MSDKFDEVDILRYRVAALHVENANLSLQLASKARAELHAALAHKYGIQVGDVIADDGVIMRAPLPEKAAAE